MTDGAVVGRPERQGTPRLQGACRLGYLRGVLAGRQAGADRQWDKTARLWDAQSGKELRTFTGHADRVDLRGVRAGRQAGADRQQRQDGAVVGRRRAARNSAPSRGIPAAVYSVAFAPDGKQVLTGSSDKTARLWDAQSGKELRAFTGHADWVRSVAFSPDGKQVLTGG